MTPLNWMGTKFNTQYFDVSACHCSTANIFKPKKKRAEHFSLKIEIYLCWGFGFDCEMCGGVVFVTIKMLVEHMLYYVGKKTACARPTLDYHFNRLLLMLIIFNVMRRSFFLFRFLPTNGLSLSIPWLWIEYNE